MTRASQLRSTSRSSRSVPGKSVTFIDPRYPSTNELNLDQESVIAADRRPGDECAGIHDAALRQLLVHAVPGDRLDEEADDVGDTDACAPLRAVPVFRTDMSRLAARTRHPRLAPLIVEIAVQVLVDVDDRDWYDPR